MTKTIKKEWNKNTKGRNTKSVFGGWVLEIVLVYVFSSWAVQMDQKCNLATSTRQKKLYI